MIRRLLTGLVAVALSGVAAAAGDPATGRLKANTCNVCHGANGMGATPDAPHLAGQPAVYLAAQLRAFRSGARKHEIMNVMARPLSDEDIEHLAAWYASLQIEVKTTP